MSREMEPEMTAPYSMLAHDILAYLQAEATGRENAKKINVLAFRFHVSRREIEQCTEELREAGIPLCSSVSFPHGLFIARDYHEMEAWVRQIDNRMAAMAVHRANAVRQLKALAARDGVQIEMEFVQ